jgi:hypothetical protein
MSVDLFIVANPSLFGGSAPLSVGDALNVFAALQHCKDFLQRSIFG